MEEALLPIYTPRWIEANRARALRESKADGRSAKPAYHTHRKNKGLQQRWGLPFATVDSAHRHPYQDTRDSTGRPLASARNHGRYTERTAAPTIAVLGSTRFFFAP